jgi:hypothetical protein
MSALADITDPGMLQFLERVRLIVREELDKRGSPVAEATRPLTAEQLCTRWKIKADTPELQLHKLARLARRWKLSPFAGTRGWAAVYAIADVVDAEARANGSLGKGGAS